MEGLFGADFEIDITKSRADVKKLAKKLAMEQALETDPEKVLKSKKLSIPERLAIINEKVIKTLGKQRQNTVVIRNLGDFSAYIDKALKVGRIAIDTETNNSTDPATCEMVGLCLYVPGEKQAYIPIKHVNYETGELLPNQLTYADCRKQLQRLLDYRSALRGGWIPDYEGQSYDEWYKIHIGSHRYPLADFKIIMHNGKFDFEVIKKTCGIEVEPTWDTIIAARLIDENLYSDKRTSLKYLYVTLIDPRQAKYDIEGLFENVPYAFVDPEIFALYAATDSMMTDKLYLWEKPFFEGVENEKLKWLFDNIEMPIVAITGRMELRGVSVDIDFGNRLKQKYNAELARIDEKINEALEELRPTIDAWRLTPEANEKTKMYVPKKTKMSKEKIEETYSLVDADGKRYKETKPKTEQLADPINLASPVQLAILFYDILKAPVVSKKSPRGTGEDELQAISEQRPDLTICSLLVKRRGIVKLITTYIDVIPELAQHWPDHRIRFKMNSMGTDTGRYSSGGKWKFLDADNQAVEISGINIQNIPSHNPEIRMLFKATVNEEALDVEDGVLFEIPEITEIATIDDYKFCKDLTPDTRIVFEDGDDARISYFKYDATAKKYILALEGSGTILLRTRYKIIGSDYSAQEPRLTAFISQDPHMVEAYKAGKDLYAVIAQSAFNNKYEDNLEFYPEGTELEIDGQKIIAGKKTHVNKSGKERRSVGKVLQLASTYGMGGAAAGSRLGKSADDGEKLLMDFFDMFKGVKKAIDDSKEHLKKYGYVEDWAGRRRHLPEINLKKYVVHRKVDEANDVNFNPILGCANRENTNDELVKAWEIKVLQEIAAYQKKQQQRITKWNSDHPEPKYQKVWANNGEMSNQLYEKLAREAEKEGIIIDANTAKIAQAERQCFNARIQGGAASLTKLAMVNIERDPELNECQAKLIISVHDEVLVECPALYADAVEKRLPQVMIDTAKPYINIPMSCDPYNVSRWYADSAAVAIRDELKKLEKGNPDKGIKPLPRDIALETIYENHTELARAVIENAITNGTDLEF